MSTTRLMILGLVRWLQPIHGYDVRRELVNWNISDWTNIQPGSIYHALKKMTGEGLLEEVDTHQVMGRPARTTYKITSEGETEFISLLGKYAHEHVPTADPFLSAFAFLPALPRQEAILACQGRAKTLRKHAQDLRALMVDPLFSSHKPPHVMWMLEIGVEGSEIQASWCDRVAERIAAGEGIHADDQEKQMAEGWRRELQGEPKF